jgi:hypothetical protein
VHGTPTPAPSPRRSRCADGCRAHRRRGAARGRVRLFIAGERTRCTRTDGDLTETIEAGGGRWLSTSERGWHPSDYVSRIAKRVWG